MIKLFIFLDIFYKEYFSDLRNIIEPIQTTKINITYCYPLNQNLINSKLLLTLDELNGERVLSKQQIGRFILYEK